MTDSELYNVWFWSLGVAALVVVIAAALLIAILLVARSILRHAEAARDAVKQIAEDTGPIWEIDTTNQVADDILQTTRSIEQRAERIVGALGRSSERIER
jgi:hypothetical protein